MNTKMNAIAGIVKRKYITSAYFLIYYEVIMDYFNSHFNEIRISKT